MTKKQRIIEKLKAHAESTNRPFGVDGATDRFTHAWIGSGERYSQSHFVSVIIGPRGGTKILLNGKEDKNTSLNIILSVYVQ